MSYNYTVWQTPELAHTYLTGVRGAIPLAQEQISVVLHLIRLARPALSTFLDLGCGDGVLGHAILDEHPTASGVFVDFSEPMLAAAQERLSHYRHTAFLQLDYGDPAWVRPVAAYAPFDLIVSGYSIHHQPDARKRAIYAELYHLLQPGGLFLNLEHVASHTTWGEQAFDHYFLDSLYTFHRQNGGRKSREQINRDYYERPDKAANILALVETQCEWLRQIGFDHVDCFLKIFELALFGGIKPEKQ
ncbi:MAG: class I SAM-dependent methyltransferase [Chloroflexi bacterium]|nr:class I SAM-dependent methyltransferase [Chloroflexota bacterium]MCI0576786.1 class I SAM-dependent methyltransferase [Chloroflexota bacterium]MCI0645338.1 class I SAM-dependent methyltransferase [Chloroflexota bacterium]MCI0725114.1 class I SAM-dependent methyltransferase [Chloroflexota bacterium]